MGLFGSCRGSGRAGGRPLRPLCQAPPTNSPSHRHNPPGQPSGPPTSSTTPRSGRPLVPLRRGGLARSGFVVGLGDVGPLDVSDHGLVEALVGLQWRAYAVEAALIGHDGIPQLTETAAELRAAGLHWLGIAGRDAQPVAALAYSWHGPVLDIERLVVDPAVFRRGLGSRLIAALPPAQISVVSTGRDNRPARALYQRHGFRHLTDVQVAPGLWVSRLRRETPPPPAEEPTPRH